MMLTLNNEDSEVMAELPEQDLSVAPGMNDLTGALQLQEDKTSASRSADEGEGIITPVADQSDYHPGARLYTGELWRDIALWSPVHSSFPPWETFYYGAENVTITDGGELQGFDPDTFMYNIYIEDGICTVGGSEARDFTVGKYGECYVDYYGYYQNPLSSELTNVTVLDGGCLYVGKNGIVHNVTVKAGGYMVYKPVWEFTATPLESDARIKTANVCMELAGGSIEADGKLILARNNLLFFDNVSWENGGALFGEFEAGDNYEFYRNSVTGCGGAICTGLMGYDYDAGTYTGGDGYIFVDNNADEEGGAIYVYGGLILGDDAYFMGNTAESGGAVYTINDIPEFGNNAQFIENSAELNGGALRGDFFAADGIRFEGNSATQGGAVYGSLRAGHNAEFINNYAAQNGGAIYQTYFCTLKDNAFFKENIAVCGGAVYGELAVGDGAGFIDNIATECGGAIHGTLRAGDQITFTDNAATDDGGAIYGVLSAGDDTHFRGNIAGRNGGAVYCENDGLTLGEDCIFAGNEAADSGGGVFVTEETSADVESGGIFEQNRAETNGGFAAVYGSMTFGANALFSENVAKSAGGAIYNDGFVRLGNGSVFDGNTAQIGGAIYNTGTIYLGSASFLTQKDTIYNKGVLEFLGDCFVGADVTVEAEAGEDNYAVNVREMSLTSTISLIGEGYLFNRGTIDFELSLEHQNTLFITDWNGVVNPQMGAFAVTVDSEITTGEYMLIGNASDFSNVVTVRNEANEAQGTVSLAGKKCYFDDFTCSLKLDNEDNLLLKVERRSPDLVISCSAAAETVIVGETLPVTITVSNTGVKTAEASLLQLQDPSGAVIKEFAVPVLEPDETYTTEWYFTPDDSLIGDYTLTAVADAAGQVDESNENNNTGALNIEILDRPDLVISSVTFSKDPMYSFETGRCQFTVANIGGSDAENFRVSVAVNGDKWKEFHVDALTAGGAQSFYMDIPGDEVPIGESLVTVTADSTRRVREKDEDNNDATVAFTVEPLPDLLITGAAFMPGVIKEGRDAYISVTVKNDGEIASEASTLSVYYSGKIVAETKVSGIAKGDSRNVTFFVPTADMQKGEHEFWLKIDNYDVVKELAEENNSCGVNLDITLPDLMVPEIALSKQAMDDNDYAYLSFKVMNEGKVDAEASQAHIYVDDKFYGYCYVEALAAGAVSSLKTYRISGRVLGAGEHRITVKADADLVIPETDEYNNTASLQLMVSENDSPLQILKPDLTISHMQIRDDKLAKDEDLTFDYVVVNDGDADAGPSKVFIFVDDEQVREISLNDIPADEDIRLSCTIPASELPFGEHNITVRVDAEDAINEYKEDNNEMTLTFFRDFIYEDEETGSNWAAPSQDGYIIHYSQNAFVNCLRLFAPTNAVDIHGIPEGVYQWRVREFYGSTWFRGRDIESHNTAEKPREFRSDNDGNLDLFFADSSSVWELGYAAQHTGNSSGLNGTGEYAVIYGKNKFTDIYTASSDANVLVLTDSENGDAFFMDDIISAFPETVASQARISQIDEIRAGIGDDVIDLTSQNFTWSESDSIKIYGGLGNDVIWANQGENTIYGDAGDDRLIGGAKNDIIIGGAGNDRMHGGGGEDIFTFGADWGNDEVEQFAGGSVTLWFENGSVDNWTEDTLTYSDGVNSVTVSGVPETDIILKFGGNIASLPEDVFAEFASEKIFEDTGRGILA